MGTVRAGDRLIMIRTLICTWSTAAALLLVRAFAAQSAWAETMSRLGKPHDYQTAAIVMAIVAATALLVAGLLAWYPSALTSLRTIVLSGSLALYALLMLALGMHQYEPAYATLAVAMLLGVAVFTCVYATIGRARTRP